MTDTFIWLARVNGWACAAMWVASIWVPTRSVERGDFLIATFAAFAVAELIIIRRELVECAPR